MKKIKILIVEDHPLTAADLKKSLLKLSFKVTKSVNSFQSALKAIDEEEPDIILMDINLGQGKRTGIELTKEIQKQSNIPILYLTAFCDDETMEEAFVTNPVGYLLKPFRIEEIKATILLAMYKINTLEYTNINQDCKDIGFGYYFDIKQKKLYYKSKYIKLAKKEQILLDILTLAKGDIVSCETIEHALWADNVPSQSSLRTLIYRLRVKLGCKIIDASYSHGYKLSHKIA